MMCGEYMESDAVSWDELVSSSPNGTFMHTRRYLQYHGDRFADRSLVFRRPMSDKAEAVFAAAVDPADPERVVSHPGITYGGLVHSSRLKLDEVVAIWSSLRAHYAARGFKVLLCRTVPRFLHRLPSDLDLYCLGREGGSIERSVLWNVLSLSGPRHLSKGRKWGIRRAKEHGIVVRREDSDAAYGEYHDLLTSCLETRHGTRPVHSVREMVDIRNRFPEQVSLWTAGLSGGGLMAGTWIFHHGAEAWHAQYIASNDEGRSWNAVEMLLEQLVAEASAAGVKFFSLGASMVPGTQEVDRGLFAFKSAFGYGNVVQHIVKWTL